MLIKKEDSVTMHVTKQSSVTEYRFASENISFATAKLDGRYPEKGKVRNKKCEEIYYVLSGTGTIHSEKGSFEIEPGDVYFFEKGELFWVDANELKVVLVNSPKWKPEQHENIE